MDMEIKINASDMLKVLVNFGLDSTESKALIFDLVTYNGQLPERNKLKDVKKQRMKKKVVEVSEEYEDDDYSDSEDDEDEEEDDDDDDDEIGFTKTRKLKKISFKNFGGPAQTIQPSKKV